MTPLLLKGLRRYHEAVTPPPFMLPSEWGRKHYVITKGPGTGKTWSPAGGWEFQIGIVDALYGPFEPGEEVREGVLFKGSKAGCTMICDMGTHFQVANQRLSAAMIAPRKPDSNDRAAEAERVILASPLLRSIYKHRKGRTKQAAHGAQLLYRSGETDRDLIDWGAPWVTADERDRWARLAFSQDSMLDKRQGGYPQRGLIWLSTPTIPRYGVHELWLESDQRAYFIRCPLPGCGERQLLKWRDDEDDGNIVWNDLASTLDGKLASARFVCRGKKCGRTWSRHWRAEANAGGEWVKQRFDVRRKGFEISRLYVPTALPREFVKDWVVGQTDPKVLKEFWNQLMGKPHMNTIGNLDYGALMRVITSEIKWERPPAGYNRIFAGVDVQDQNERPYYPWEVRAYNDRGDCALIAYGIAMAPDELKAALTDSYGGHRVTRALIDISDGQHKPAVEARVEEIECLEAARFDHHAKVAFQRVKRERAGEKKSHGISGWSVKREDALDDVMTRFFEQDGKPPSIAVALNPHVGRQKEWISHYTKLRRVQLDTARGPQFEYQKPAMGCDYPFAGALAEVARRIAGMALPASRVEVRTPSSPKPPGLDASASSTATSSRPGSQDPGHGLIRVGRRRNRYF